MTGQCIVQQMDALARIMAADDPVDSRPELARFRRALAVDRRSPAPAAAAGGAASATLDVVLDVEATEL